MRQGEGPRTARLFGFIFLITTAAVLARSAQREVFLAAYPRSAISDAFLYSAVGLMLASLGISALASRVSLGRLTQGMLLGGALLILAGRLSLWWVPQWAPMGLYVLVEVLVSLLLAQGWSLAGEALDVRSAKRLLPLVGIGAGLAWTVGGFSIGLLAKQAGPSLILTLAPVALLGAFGMVRLIRRHDLREAPVPTSSNDTGFLQGLLSGLKYVATEPLLRVLAIIITVELVVERVTDLQLLASAQEHFAGQSGGIAAFMGLFYGITGAVTLVAPLASGRLLSKFGSTRALLSGQLFVLAGSLLFLLIPQFAVVVLLSGGDRILKQAVGGAARSQVMGAIPSGRRTQAGALLRGVLAAAFSALAAIGLKAVPPTVPVQWLSIGTVALTGVLLFITRRDLKRSYLQALRRSVDRSRLDIDGHTAKTQLDKEQLATLADELDSPDPTRASLTVSLLAAARPELARPLLHRALLHASSEVRAQAASVLGRSGAPADRAVLLQALIAAGEDPVRCACLKALAEVGAVEAFEALAPFTASESASVRAMAHGCRLRLLELTNRVDARELSAFAAMMASADPEEREASAWAVGQVGLRGTEVRQGFTQLLVDGRQEVRRAAVGAAGQFDDEAIVRALVYALEEPAIASRAFDAFSQLADAGVNRVQSILQDAPVAIVSRTATALSRGEGARATQVLTSMLDHAEPQVRYRASRALLMRRRQSSWSPPAEELLRRAMEAELTQGYRYLATLAGLERECKQGDAEHRFVAGELDSRIQETERRLLALVALVADPRIARLSHHLRDASPQVTARVLELVEESLEQSLSELVVPFLERHQPGQPARPGTGRFAVPPSFGDDPIAALMGLGDGHLRLVAMQAFRTRVAAHFHASDLPNQEDPLLRMVERLRFLRSVPVFKNLSPEDLMKLAEIASPVEHHAGKVIFKKGDPGDVLCVVVRGRVEIRNHGQVIATQLQNDFFGELALFDQEPRSADAVCVEDTELLEIGGADLESLMERRPEIAREIIRVLAKRLRKTTQELVERPPAPALAPARTG